VTALLKRLSDAQVDELADALENLAKPASEITFQAYPSPVDPGRRISLQRARDWPRPGLTTAITLGLAHYSWEPLGVSDRIEMVFVWDQPSFEYERLLVAVVGAVHADPSVLPRPGRIYRGAASAAGLPDVEKTMPNALLLIPYLWGPSLHHVDITGARVRFLQVVPVTEKESQFIRDQGFETFEEILEAQGADFYRMKDRHPQVT
jgi:Suppressor of fused protein (SUFU)